MQYYDAHFTHVCKNTPPPPPYYRALRWFITHSAEKKFRVPLFLYKRVSPPIVSAVWIPPPIGGLVKYLNIFFFFFSSIREYLYNLNTSAKITIRYCIGKIVRQMYICVCIRNRISVFFFFKYFFHIWEIETSGLETLRGNSFTNNATGPIRNIKKKKKPNLIKC